MIVKEEFLNKLRRSFNLNIYEVKIWTALLSRGISTAGELSDISEVPRSRSYDILETLEKKGFIVMKLGKPIQYIAVPPEEVMKRVKRRVHNSADRQLELLENIKKEKVYDELQLLYKQGITFVDANTLSGAFKGRDNLYDHLEAVFKNAKKSVTIMTTADGLVRKAEALKSALRRGKTNGVKVRIAAPINKTSQKAAESLREVAEVRNIDKISARFAIVDNKNITFMVMDDKEVHESYDVGIWANTPFFATALENMFNLTWNTLGKGKSK